MLQIGVIGAGKAKGAQYELAEDVGREIAKAGHILICGGLYGVMEAAARGAKSQGGLTIGILPGGTTGDANEYIDVRIVTAMSHARNAIITRTADVLIAVGGGLGTLSEITLALKIGKPVVILKGAPPKSLIEDKNIHLADSPEESVKLAEKLGLEKQE
jgi:uncharacterized protein (TIGR00725 family)